jgi:signal transduction histidine kinase
MAVIQRNAQMQAKLIEDLLEMNKLASGTVRLEVAPLDVGAVIAGTIESLKPTADAKGVHLETRRESPLPWIHADGRRVQQILWNLLHNAVKFTRAGGRVEVAASCVEGCVRIAAEYGQGIALSSCRTLDRFRQADPSTTRGPGALTRAVDREAPRRAARGPIRSESGPDKGATFVVELPVRPVDETMTPVRQRHEVPSPWDRRRSMS